ncbi:hypothetical protein Tco_0550360 [Tanacetum coccineum]
MYYSPGRSCAPNAQGKSSWHILARDCRSITNANTANNQRGIGGRKCPETTCYECGAKDISMRGVKTEVTNPGTSGNGNAQQGLCSGKKCRNQTDVIICAENIIRIPWGNETLIVRGDESTNEHRSRLNIISSTKTQKYLLKGCQVFLAHVTTKKAEDKSKEK